MRTYLDCYPCFFRQALEAARMNGANEQEQRAILGQVMRMLETVDLAAMPAEIAHRVHGVVRAALQVGDPYRTIKAESTRRALALYEHLKAVPIVNDALREDALAAGLDRVAAIIDNGSDAPGTILSQCSATLRAEFDAAGLIVAKGQANYETLSDCGRDVFFLLQVKCPVISQHAGVPVGSMVIQQGLCR